MRVSRENVPKLPAWPWIWAQRGREEEEEEEEKEEQEEEEEEGGEEVVVEGGPILFDCN